MLSIYLYVVCVMFFLYIFFGVLKLYRICTEGSCCAPTLEWKIFGTQMKSISFARSFPRTFLVSMNENGKKWMNKKKVVQKLEGRKIMSYLEAFFSQSFPQIVIELKVKHLVKLTSCQQK